MATAFPISPGFPLCFWTTLGFHCSKILYILILILFLFIVSYLCLLPWSQFAAIILFHFPSVMIQVNLEKERWRIQSISTIVNPCSTRPVLQIWCSPSSLHCFQKNSQSQSHCWKKECWLNCVKPYEKFLWWNLPAVGICQQNHNVHDTPEKQICTEV